MKEIISELLKRLTQIISVQETQLIFIMGILSGLVLVILLCIFFRILFMLLKRDKKVAEIKLDTEYGTVAISAAAISDLVHSLSGKHPLLETERTVLINDKGSLILKVKAYYSAEEGASLVNVSKAFQDDVLSSLEKALGVTSVEKVVLIIPRCRS